MMRPAKVVAYILGMAGVCGMVQRVSAQTPAHEPARGKRIVIAASTVLDGKGGVLHDARSRGHGSRLSRGQSSIRSTTTARVVQHAALPVQHRARRDHNPFTPCWLMCRRLRRDSLHHSAHASHAENVRNDFCRRIIVPPAVRQLILLSYHIAGCPETRLRNTHPVGARPFLRFSFFL